MAEGYRRVSKKSPCQVCGKPDWCSTTVDRGISFCARSTTYANRISREGWGIYYQNFIGPQGPFNVRPSRRRVFSKCISIASIERRDAVYRKLIQLSPIGKGCNLDLDERLRIGQKSDHPRYGYYPLAAITRDRLAAMIAESYGNSKNDFSGLKGVPGFWRGRNGSPRLGIRFDLVTDLLLIPFLDTNGLVQACQLRYSNPSSTSSNKYLWLSSTRERDGCGPGTPLHHEGALRFGGRLFETVLVTEGALKAATVQNYLPDRYVVGNSGVATSHQEIVKAARKKRLEIAFDADSFTNPHVARSLASLIAIRIREQQFLSYDQPVSIITWDKRFKGIDDALRAGATLKYLDVPQWLRLLTHECNAVARDQLAGLLLRK